MALAGKEIRRDEAAHAFMRSLQSTWNSRGSQEAKLFVTTCGSFLFRYDLFLMAER